MIELHTGKIAAELQLPAKGVRAVLSLLNEGATVPFIARYRKEMTGTLDEQAVFAIQSRQERLVELDKRRESILASLRERNLLEPPLEKALLEAPTMALLEDLYLPFRPKRRTRATIARERGLEPLAHILREQKPGVDPLTTARDFVSQDRGVPAPEDALEGARDIVAEWVNENPEVRRALRDFFEREGVLFSRVVKGKEDEGAKFKDYFDWSEPVRKMAGHRFLAMVRGEREEILRLSLRPPEEPAVNQVASRVLRQSCPAREQVRMALEDAYKRLLAPSLETEIRQTLKERADQEAIGVFAGNLRDLLLAPPLGGKPLMAIDPGFRTGAKVVCLDAQGKLLDHAVIFPLSGAGGATQARQTLMDLMIRYRCEVIAVGNGTGGRETEAFVRANDFGRPVTVVLVDESGASVYSASDVARAEFPDHDLTVRGAVSIGRRLMDPLAELVKIDPKAIGVGQYQHDVDQGNLKRSLDDVVMSCVNAVGVEVNTASSQLLQYASGLGPQLAKNLTAYRDEHGPLKSRSELKKVPRLGPKAFEQAAGFLRIRDGKNPLDASAVHPESYPIVEKMAADLGCDVRSLMTNPELQKRVRLESYVSDRVGVPTLRDIMAELAKPGRDPRERFEVFQFDESVQKLEDVKPGMVLPGIVTNVTKFGAFVNIGVHQDGLIHISEMADRFIKDPNEVVKVQQKLQVRVLEIDLPRKRIALSLRRKPSSAPSS